MKGKPTQQQADTQAERFKKAARELGCDEDETHFDEKLKQVARHKLAPESAKKTARKKATPKA